MACQPAASLLAETLHLPLDNGESLYTLELSEEHLALVFRKKPSPTRIQVDFVKGPFGYRLAQGGKKNQAIAKAVGLHRRKEKPTVLDVTAGLGKDGFLLASLGCTVHLVERSRIIAALLIDGLKRAENNATLQPMTRLIKVTVADGREILQHVLKAQAPDVIYLDPMFPSKTKSALSKIEMQMLRDIVGKDEDANELLLLALEKAKQRVVVKRPKQASPLSNLTPSFVVPGKSSRYDIYLTKNHSESR